MMTFPKGCAMASGLWAGGYAAERVCQILRCLLRGAGGWHARDVAPDVSTVFLKYAPSLLV